MKHEKEKFIQINFQFDVLTFSFSRVSRSLSRVSEVGFTNPFPLPGLRSRPKAPGALHSLLCVCKKKTCACNPFCDPVHGLLT